VSDGGVSSAEGSAEPAPASAPVEQAAAQPAVTPEARARRLALVRGALITLLGSSFPFLIMATDRHWSFSVPVGFASCLVATLGIFQMLRAFDAPDADVVASIEFGKLGPRLIELVASGVVLTACLRLAVAGVLPKPIATAAILITGSFIWLVVSLFRSAQSLGCLQKDELGNERGLLARYGFWLILLNTLLYLPLLGSFSLSDPWETHYGEVAREMLARDDWISLWWAQDGWFWSKPVLDFWMQGLFFSLLGVRFMPDQMLASVADGRFPQPEWAARFPVFLLTLLGVYLLYKGVAKVWGRRAGFLGGLVLTTMPYWYFISHQTMTDMPYVAPLAGGMGLLLLGFHTDPEARVKVYEVAIGRLKLRVSAFHLLLTAFALLVLPQILYLLSRNLTLQIDATPHGFRPHPDEFFLGSGGGNCGLPGNEACRTQQAVNRQIQPALWGLIWAGLGAVFIAFNRNERRVQRLAFLGAWLLVAVSAMAKGAPGLVLPIFVALVYIGATKRWRDLQRIELPSMLLLVACIVLPWYVVMHMRHGPPFIDRLLFHDMYKRAFVHVHDTNVGDDVSFRYYVWQLGYGLFPWSGLAAAGLVWWMRRGDESRDARADVASFMLLWFITGFALFTISLTKFHHYVFPAVPPIAMLVGVLLDRMLGDRPLCEPGKLGQYLAALGIGSALLIYGCFRLFPGAISGWVVDGQPPAPSRVLGAASILLGLITLVLARRRFDVSQAAARVEPSSSRFESAMLGALGICSGIVVAIAGRDLFTTVRGDIDGQSRLVHLFTYNYRRPWPESLNFNAILIGFTLVAAVLCALIALERWRPHVTAAICAVGVIWCAWGVNVYHYKTAPHWGQRETVMAYYKDRKSPDQPFVSYQMNWKGENFYTGNRTPAFVSSGQRFKEWIDEQKGKGVNVMYFTTEHGRIGALKSEIGPHKKFDVITSIELNNKFLTARVEL